jgi:hypothetical protein
MRLVDEQADRVYVRVILCSPPDTHISTGETDGPWNVWLDDEPSVYVPRPPGAVAARRRG